MHRPARECSAVRGRQVSHTQCFTVEAVPWPPVTSRTKRAGQGVLRRPPEAVHSPQPPVQLVPTGENAAHHHHRPAPSTTCRRLPRRPQTGIEPATARTRCQRVACGSKTIRRRVRVARAKRSWASVDGRTFPPSMRATPAMQGCDVFIFFASCDCDKPAAVRASILVMASLPWRGAVLERPRLLASSRSS